MAFEEVTRQRDRKGVSWWQEHAWSEDTLDLLLSSADAVAPDGEADYVLRSFHQLVDRSDTDAPPDKFCFRVGASITLGRRVSLAELDDATFVKETWEQMSRDPRPAFKGLLPAISWHLAETSEYVNLLELDSKPIKGDGGGHLKNPKLSPERLREGWEFFKDRLNIRDFNVYSYSSLVENPSLPSDVAADMFDKFIWAVFTEEGQEEFKYASDREGDLLNRILINLLNSRSLPRGVFERHVQSLHSSLPVKGSWSPGKASFVRRRPQVLMPWYSTEDEVKARWKEVFGHEAEVADNLGLSAYERLNLTTLAVLAGVFPSKDPTPDEKKVPTLTPEVEAVTTLTGLLDGTSRNARGVIIQGGDYSDDVWALIYRFINQPRGGFFTTQMGYQFRDEIFAGENVPDWLRFNVGVNAFQDEDMNGRWLSLHGGALSYVTEMGLDGVPIEWVSQVLSPAEAIS